MTRQLVLIDVTGKQGRPVTAKASAQNAGIDVLSGARRGTTSIRRRRRRVRHTKREMLRDMERHFGNIYRSVRALNKEVEDFQMVERAA